MQEQSRKPAIMAIAARADKNQSHSPSLSSLSSLLVLFTLLSRYFFCCPSSLVFCYLVVLRFLLVVFHTFLCCYVLMRVRTAKHRRISEKIKISVLYNVTSSNTCIRSSVWDVCVFYFEDEGRRPGQMSFNFIYIL
jgi:hypothetical protein